MSKQNFYQTLQQEVARIDTAQVAKRHERVIEGFTDDPNPRALIDGKKYLIANSNDYLGLRHHPMVKQAELAASEKYGAGPGAVRFISGSLKIHRDLEQALAKFHSRDDGMIFSSAFATNMGVLFSLLKGQSKDSVLQSSVMVVSDELNHRSIIDGIRIAGLDKEAKQIFKHMDARSLAEILKSGVGKFDRVLVVTDGVFSMLGEIQKLDELEKVIAEYDSQYPQGVLLVVDDAHGVGACGATGRGAEEVAGAKSDVLIGTMGKAFGADGGYVVADQVVIDYLRESAATYIYSNNIPPATAGAALASIQLMDQPEGKKLVKQLSDNVVEFKKIMSAAGFEFAADSSHPIQPLLMGDPARSKAVTKGLFDRGYLVTSINYPVVPKGRDEIRVQISAAQTSQDLQELKEAFMEVFKKLGI